MPREPETDLTPEDPQLADFLTQRRPLPPARFRGALGRRLEALDPGWGPRPERLLVVVAGYLGLGTVLIALAALVGLGGV